MAIKNNIAIYAFHTNLDNAGKGLNNILCEKLGVVNRRILLPKEGMLRKLVTFCPVEHAEKVRQAIFASGAGQIGNYDSCSFNAEGLGSFRGGENTNPFVGSKGAIHFEKEVQD
jgi:putative NIF3 family GTP cyclohydrolase 1 type 2